MATTIIKWCLQDSFFKLVDMHRHNFETPLNNLIMKFAHNDRW